MKTLLTWMGTGILLFGISTSAFANGSKGHTWGHDKSHHGKSYKVKKHHAPKTYTPKTHKVRKISLAAGANALALLSGALMIVHARRREAS